MIDWRDISWIEFLDRKMWEILPASSRKSRNSENIIFRCPICGDSRKSKFKKRGYYYRKTGTYTCWNCNTHITGYDLLKFICSPEQFSAIVQEYQVLNFKSILNGIKPSSSQASSQDSGFEILSPSPSYGYLLDLGWKVQPLSQNALTYLGRRRVPSERRDMFRTMVDSEGREFLLIQYLWDDRCIYHQLANFNGYDIAGQGPVKYVFPKDESINFQSKPVFNLSSVSISFPYIICVEGVFDSLFVKNGVALGGRVLTSYQEEMLSACFPHHKVVLALDNDYAGMQSTLKHAERHPDMLFLDDSRLLNAASVKDINDFVVASGRDDVFSNEGVLKSMMCSAFKMKMKMQLS